MPVLPSHRPWDSDHKGKQKRQRAILDAAREMISAEGAADFRMREVAVKAQVSTATLYNLFGSKNAILQAIYDQEYAAFNEFFGSRSSDEPLSRLFEIVPFAFLYYEERPALYGQLVNLNYCDAETDFVFRASWPQIAYAADLVQQCVTTGDLDAETPVAVISSFYIRTFIALCQEWLDGFTTSDAACDELGRGLTILLSAYVTPAGRELFDRIRLRYQVDRRQGGRR